MALIGGPRFPPWLVTLNKTMLEARRRWKGQREIVKWLPCCNWTGGQNAEETNQQLMAYVRFASPASELSNSSSSSLLLIQDGTSDVTDLFAFVDGSAIFSSTRVRERERTSQCVLCSVCERDSTWWFTGFAHSIRTTLFLHAFATNYSSPLSTRFVPPSSTPLLFLETFFANIETIISQYTSGYRQRRTILNLHVRLGMKINWIKSEWKDTFRYNS